jgi:hypothetical protein
VLCRVWWPRQGTLRSCTFPAHISSPDNRPDHFAEPSGSVEAVISGKPNIDPSSSRLPEATTTRAGFDEDDRHMTFSFGGIGNPMDDDLDLLQLLTNNVLPFSESVQASTFLDAFGVGSENWSSAPALGYMAHLPTSSSHNPSAELGPYPAGLGNPSDPTSGAFTQTTRRTPQPPAGPALPAGSQKSPRADAWAGSAVRGQEAVTEAHTLILNLVSLGEQCRWRVMSADRCYISRPALPTNRRRYPQRSSTSV